MSLAPGTRLGAYEVNALIGVGGMGQVLASLNHPHIAQIHGFEEQTDVVSGFSRTVQALVLELVDGLTLADLIGKVRFLSTRRCRSQSRLPKHSKPHMSTASSIAI